MKKILFLVLLIPSLVWAQSDAANKAKIDSLLTNTARNNNAKFFDRILNGLNDSKLNKDSSNLTLTTNFTSGAATYNKSTRTLNVPNYVSNLPANASGVLKNNGSGTLSWTTDVSTFQFGQAWQSVTLINGWANINTLQYRIVGLDIIQFRGVIDGSSASSDQFAAGLPIPQGAAGNVNIQLPIINTTGSSLGILKVNTGGNGFIDSHGSNFYDLNGIQYTK